MQTNGHGDERNEKFRMNRRGVKEAATNGPDCLRQFVQLFRYIQVLLATKGHLSVLYICYI